MQLDKVDRVYAGSSTIGVTVANTRPDLDTSATRSNQITLSGQASLNSGAPMTYFSVTDTLNGSLVSRYSDTSPTVDSDGTWLWTPYLLEGVHEFSVTGGAD